MRATVWSGRNTVQVENVPDPTILNARDAIVKVTSTAICGSDLHLYDGYVPTMKHGDILGHESMGEVVDVRQRRREPQGRRPRRRAVPDRLRQLLVLPARALLAV
jgi:threonine dehydrogenase-like Zn-dependent dehydrogenase